MGDGKITLRCDRITHKPTFLAVLFAIRMMRTGTSPGVANVRAAKYYGATVADVAFYTAQHAARVAANRRGTRRGFDGEA